MSAKTDSATGVWNTKYGKRRVRQNPPTVQEAFVAAQCMTDDPREQAEFAASLMGIPVADALAQAPKPVVRPVSTTMVSTGRSGLRTVVVERRIRRVRAG